MKQLYVLDANRADSDLIVIMSALIVKMENVMKLRMVASVTLGLVDCFVIRVSSQESLLFQFLKLLAC